MKEKHIQELEGKTLTKLEWNSEEAILDTATERYRLFHAQDCCESVTLDSVEGDMFNIIGEQIIKAEELIGHDDPKGEHESVTFTDYRLTTAKGSVLLKWIGSSNGYYSESVEFHQLEPREALPCSPQRQSALGQPCYSAAGAPQPGAGMNTELEQLIDAIEDLELEVFWSNRRPMLTCNDAFYWGTADCEELTVADIPEIGKAHADSKDYNGTLLFIARKRGERLQGAMYAHLGEVDWPLFDACGPARESNFGNPVGTDQIPAYVAKRKAEKENEACALALTGVPDPAEFVRRVRALLGSVEQGLGGHDIEINEARELLAMLPAQP